MCRIRNRYLEVVKKKSEAYLWWGLLIPKFLHIIDLRRGKILSSYLDSVCVLLLEQKERATCLTNAGGAGIKYPNLNSK